MPPAPSDARAEAIAKAKAARRSSKRKTRAGGKDLPAPSLSMLGWGMVMLLALAAFIAPISGLYTIDEAIYVLQANALWDFGSYALPVDSTPATAPGFADKLMLIQPDGRIIPQYPPLYPLLAGPLLHYLGVPGMILLNIAGMVAVAMMLRPLVRHLGGSEGTGRAAQLLFLLGGFVVQYAMGIWPHMFTLGLTCGAALAGVSALQAGTAKRQMGMAALGGMLLGLACGVRVDSFFLLPALLLPPLFCRPINWRVVAGVLAGLVLPMAVLTLINCNRLGMCLPMTYGLELSSGANTSVTRYVGPAVALVIVVAALRFAMLSGATRQMGARLGLPLLGLGMASLLALALFGQNLPDPVDRFAAGLRTVLLDVPAAPVPAAGSYEPIAFSLNQASEDIAPIGGGNTVTQRGQIISFGALKKALLQSLPWLPLLLVPIMWLAGGLRSYAPQPAAENKAANAHPHAAHWLLLLSIALPVGVFTWFNWVGGQAANMRYLIPILPAAAVFAAMALDWLARGDDDTALQGFWKPRFYFGMLALLPFIWPTLATKAGLPSFSFAASEWIILTWPLVLAGLLAAALLAFALTRQPIARQAASLLAPLAITHAGLIGLIHDWGGDMPARIPGYAFTKDIEAHITEPGAVLLYDQTNGYFLRSVAGAVASRDLILFRPYLIDDQESAGVIARYRAEDRPIYAAMSKELQQRLATTPGLQDATWTLLRDADAPPLSPAKQQAEANPADPAPEATEDTEDAIEDLPPQGPPNIWKLSWDSPALDPAAESP